LYFYHDCLARPEQTNDILRNIVLFTHPKKNTPNKRNAFRSPWRR
jgi:hypothetical protein